MGASALPDARQQRAASQFRQYLTTLRNGVEHKTAFSEAFNDIEVLERELFDYVRNFLFPALAIEFAERVVAEAERGTTIDDIEGEMHVADLQARVGRSEEARAKLKTITDRKPDAALAWAALGLIEFRERRIKEAMPLLERAAERGLSNAFVQASVGRALIASYNEATASEVRADLLQKARVVLSRAGELDPNSSYAAGMLGYVELAIGSDLPRATSLLERAVRLAPSREQYRLMLAQALLRQREFQRATDQLGPLMATGRSPEVREDARRLLTIAADARARAAAASAPATTSAPASSDGFAPLSSVGFAPTAGASAPLRFRLDLRAVQSGESRALGQFTGIECNKDLMTLRIQADGRVLRLAAKQLSDIDFITYRTDTPGSVSCGPLAMPMRALVTYRARSATTEAIDGDAVAIELLPDDYQPNAVVR